ncbi:MAG: alkyl sulfatase dimerization domain-containing protein [Halieaceae bacterium]|jgi:alkyl sulfatase BDS1-like metallo-beta-lactamase superfamily hydrolase|nr:alkyl sulfatase dimerization domain-containing protein [Halieaceae bacterium]
MTDLLRLSSDVIDGRIELERAGPLNRINHQLSEIADGLAVVEAFSHCIVFSTDEGLVTFDTSNEQGGALCVDAIRGWRRDPFHTIVFTHGHIDHVGGSAAFMAEDVAPTVVGHENVARRFERYRLTNGYNKIINERQFGQFRRRGYDLAGHKQFLPVDTPVPDTSYRETLELQIGGMDFHLKHARGETDDHTWAWVPRHKAICAGDFFIWAFPNAGNPQKAQRYPREWAAAMREMASFGAELFLPAHGLPIQGRERIAGVLDDVATALETLVEQTLQLMNEGARLNDIIHSVVLPPGTLDKPWLAPTYDEPEFVVQNIWRLYGGWYDGNPANLKPAPEQRLASELAALAGGARSLAERAVELQDDDPRLACHLVEMAALAAPENAAVHAMRAEVYRTRRSQETSLMAKGIFGAATNESQARADRDAGKSPDS